MSITEALAWACPVVATKTCYFPELTEYQCGVETDLDPQSLSQGLIELLKHSDAARDMGRRGRQLVLERYTWPQIAEQTVQAYQDCIQR